jgi:N-acetylglucosamine-6-phosphate deacetylase
MTSYLITGGNVYTPYQEYSPGAVIVDGNRIRAAGHPKDIAQFAPHAEIIDVGGARIIPGLIDLHIHGAGGWDVNGTSLAGVIRFLPEHGITAFMPTAYPVAPDTLLSDLADMADVVESPPAGAHVLGIHLEGPFLSPHKPGMADPALLTPITRQKFDLLQDAARGHIRMVTFAPEEGEGLGIIPWLVEQKVIPVIGHSDASFDLVGQAVALGLCHATHTYNAMRGFHHREPGVLGAVLYYPQIIGELIADGHHVHPAAMAVMLRAKGVEGTCLISDAQPFATLPAGRYTWGAYELVTDGQTSRLPDGTLAGSAQLMNTMLRVLVEEVGLSFAEAVTAGTSVPAQAAGLNKGQLVAGFDADIVALNDNYQAVLTMIGGQVIVKEC